MSTKSSQTYRAGCLTVPVSTCTGLCIEHCALRWQDMDAKAGIAWVRQTLERGGKHPAFGTVNATLKVSQSEGL